jgi:hypothetical protein
MENEEYRKKNDNEHREIRESIQRLDTAFFGDEEHKGMEKVILEMYEIVVATKNFYRISKYIILALTTIGALFVTFKELFKK